MKTLGVLHLMHSLQDGHRSITPPGAHHQDIYLIHTGTGRFQIHAEHKTGYTVIYYRATRPLWTCVT